MRVGSFDLHKAFTADRLVATPSVIEIGRIIKEANGAFASLLVNENLERLAVDEWVVGQVHLSWSKVSTRTIS